MAAVAAALTALVAPAPVSADPVFIERTEWVDDGGLPSLRVYPTSAGRTRATQVGAGADGLRAWHEVLASAPDAGTPGMRDQFFCHWSHAEFARPGEASWNLEPWRPVVDIATMLKARCKPGAAEEAS